MWIYSVSYGKIKKRSLLTALYLSVAAAAMLVLVTASSANAYTYNSTNELNKSSSAPGRVGQAAPHVELNAADTDSVTLTFKNPSVALACFEYRTDGDTSEVTGTNPSGYPETDRYPSLCMGSGASDEVRTINADSYVEVRSAFGAESDWFFDWASFDVLNPDPTDSHQLTLSGSLYRDIALNNCDNRNECLFERTDESLQDWTVRLYKEDGGSWVQVASDQTDANGTYKFPQQKQAGTYHVCEVLESGWTQPNQTWSGSGYLVNTANASGVAGEGPYCTTTNYADTGDRSSKSQIGNVDVTAPEDAYFTSPTTGSNQADSVAISVYIEDYATGLGQQQIVMRRPDNSVAGNWSYNVKNGTSNVIAGTGTISYVGNSHAGVVTVLLDTNTLGDGRYNLRLFAKDAVGNGRSNIYNHFFIDNTAPEKVLGTNIVIGATTHACGVVTNQRSITVDWNDSSDPNFAHYQYQADANQASPFDFTTTVIPSERSGTIRDEDGTYNYRIRAIDSLGNIGEWSDWCSVTLDRVAPEANITSHSNGDTVSGNITVIGDVTDENPHHYYAVIRDDSGAVVGGPGTVNEPNSFTGMPLFSFDTTTVPDGNYTLWLAARDAAGNRDDSISLSTIDVVIDNTTPTAVQPVITPAANTNNNQQGNIPFQNTPTQPQPLIAAAPQQQGQDVLGANTNEDEDEQNTNEDETGTNGNVLQASTDNTAEDIEENAGCSEIFGICWYLWIIPVVGILVYIFFRFAKESDK